MREMGIIGKLQLAFSAVHPGNVILSAQGGRFARDYPEIDGFSFRLQEFTHDSFISMPYTDKDTTYRLTLIRDPRDEEMTALKVTAISGRERRDILYDVRRFIISENQRAGLAMLRLVLH